MSLFTAGQMGCFILLDLVGLGAAAAVGSPGVIMLFFVLLVMLLAGNIQILNEKRGELPGSMV